MGRDFIFCGFDTNLLGAMEAEISTTAEGTAVRLEIESAED